MQSRKRQAVSSLLTVATTLSLSSPRIAFSEVKPAHKQLEAESYSLTFIKGKARDYILKGDPQKAIDLLKSTKEESRKRTDADYFFILGRAYQDLRMNTEAIINYSISIHLDPGHVKAFINRGLTRGSLQDLSGAIADLNQALELEPKNTAALINRGVALAGLNQLAQAAEEFNKALDVDPQLADAYRNRGITRHFLKDEKGACSDWRRAGTLASEDAWIWVKYFCNRKMQSRNPHRESDLQSRRRPV